MSNYFVTFVLIIVFFKRPIKATYKRTQYRPHYPIVDYAIPGRVGPAFQNSRVVLSNTPLVTELLRGLDHVFTFFFVKSRLYVKLSI